MKKSWTCNHGCKESKNPCMHLERLLSNPGRGNMKLESMIEYQDIVMRSSNDLPIDNSIEHKLRRYGLKEHEIDLLLDRYISNLSLTEIAKKEGYVNKQAVWRLLTDLVNRLKRSVLFKQLLLIK